MVNEMAQTQKKYCHRRTTEHELNRVANSSSKHFGFIQIKKHVHLTTKWHTPTRPKAQVLTVDMLLHGAKLQKN